LVTERNQRIRIKGDVSLKRKSGALGIEADLPGKVNSYGLEITELCTHLQGQLVAVNPAYDSMFDGFAPEHVRGNPKARTAWAIDFIKKSGTASGRLGLTSHGSFSGALLWHTVYPWPQRFERFLEATNNHSRANILYDPSHFVLQQLDYMSFIDHYHERIKAFHVKDAEFNPTGKQGVYGGYSDWKNRAGRFRSLGDGQVDFKGIFSKLSKYECDVWAVLEWE